MAPARMPLCSVLDKLSCSDRSSSAFPAVSIRPLTRGIALRRANSSLEERARRRFWLSQRISPPRFDFAPLCSMGPSSTLPIQRRPAQVWRARRQTAPQLRGPIRHTSQRPPLTQNTRFRARKCGGEQEYRRLLRAGHCGLRRRPRPPAASGSGEWLEPGDEPDLVSQSAWRWVRGRRALPGSCLRPPVTRQAIASKFLSDTWVERFRRREIGAAAFRQARPRP
jgi:hypothetical protein